MIDRKHQDQYLIYARKSTDDLNNQKNSIEYQRIESLRYSQNCRLQIARADIDRFCKDGIIEERHSAYKTSSLTIGRDGSVNYKIERPKFQKLVQLLQTRIFRGVICLCWDRLSRNDHDAIIIRQLIGDGIDIHFVQTKYDDSSSGHLHMDIDSMFAKHYSRVTSEKIKSAFHKLAQEGKYPRRAPVGYLDNGPDNKMLDPERDPIVKRIFELYATGDWSFSQLAKWANQQGLTSKPRRKKRSEEEMLVLNRDDLPQKVRPITPKYIETLIRNPFFAGKIEVSPQNYINGLHTALIGLGLFQKVQTVLRSRTVSVYYVDKPFFIFRGMIRCECGRLYTPYKKKGINYYRAKCTPSCKNSVKNITERLFNEQIELFLGEIYFKRLLRLLLPALNWRHQKQILFFIFFSSSLVRVKIKDL